MLQSCRRGCAIYIYLDPRADADSYDTWAHTLLTGCKLSPGDMCRQHTRTNRTRCLCGAELTKQYKQYRRAPRIWAFSIMALYAARLYLPSRVC